MNSPVEYEMRERMARVETKVDLLLTKLDSKVERLEERVRAVEGKWLWATGCLAAFTAGLTMLKELLLK
jgi:hypothetical protein